MNLFCMLLVCILAILLPHQNAVVKGEICRPGYEGKCISLWIELYELLKKKQK